MRMAAALIVQSGKRLGEAIGILEEGSAGCTDEIQRAAVDSALATLHTKIPDLPAMLRVSERLVQRYPDAEFAVLARVTALRFAKRPKEAETLLGEAARRNPSVRLFRRLRFEVLADQERFDAAASAFDALLAAGEADAGTLNTRSWMACFQGRVTERDLEIARQAVSAWNRQGAIAPLHTLAALYAETGRGEEAIKVLGQVFTARQCTRPSPPDWYVIGRLAEHYGLGPAARDAYTRALAPPAGPWRPLSCSELARRRLRNLGKDTPGNTAVP
jgi:tetratricopeptide (TPR) repeat protein